jgi:alkylation response protein AidB-like acyl-CoA dehydrogenase
MPRDLFDDDHHAVRSTAKQFITTQMVQHFDRWESQGYVDRDLFRSAADVGLISTAIPVEYGGGGVEDFRFNVVLNEELHFAGVTGAGLALVVQADIVLPYFLRLTSTDQRQRWLPGIATGDKVLAIAITEPGAGSDVAGIATSAKRDGDVYVLNGSKTFITNGSNADLVIVAARSGGADRHRGLSLLVVERGVPGFSSGPQLDKVGLRSEDTTELFFEDVRVPVANRLGEEGEGFALLMQNLPQERLSIAVSAVASARRALELTTRYCNERNAFGAPISALQNTKFKLAEMAAEVEVAQAYVDRCVSEHVAMRLTPVQAATAKWWCTEMLKRVVDGCVQLHGGYGYMREYDIARMFLDARVTTIYGGTTEVMKEIVGRALTSPQPVSSRRSATMSATTEVNV